MAHAPGLPTKDNRGETAPDMYDRPAGRGTVSISVIVPAFNAASYLALSLPPLIALRDAGRVREVIVVDDGSADKASPDTARALGATVLVMPRNAGPGAARNFGAQMAAGELLWFVDADVVAHAAAPDVLAREFRDPAVWAVFGSYNDKPPARNFASQYKNLVHRYFHQRGRREASTFWAGCGAVRRDAFLSVGGFDRNVFKRPSIEDIELGYRLIDAGGRIRLSPDLLGTHLKRWSLAELVRTDVFQRAVPWSRLLLSGKRRAGDLNVSPAEKIRAVLAAGWVTSLAAALVPALHPLGFWAAAAATAVVFAANAPLFGFFARIRGAGFAALGLLYHQVYYLYGLAAYAWCLAELPFASRRAANAGGAVEASPASRGVP